MIVSIKRLLKMVGQLPFGQAYYLIATQMAEIFVDHWGGVF